MSAGLGKDSTFQIVANPVKEHEEKLAILADLGKRLEKVKGILGVKTSQEGALEVQQADNHPGHRNRTFAAP